MRDCDCGHKLTKLVTGACYLDRWVCRSCGHREEVSWVLALPEFSKEDKDGDDR